MNNKLMGGCPSKTSKAKDSGKPSKVRETRTRPWKKRSWRACTSCRARRVRCDVVPLGNPPCSNCRHHEIECCLSPSTRRTRPVNTIPVEAEEDAFRIDTNPIPEVNCAAGLDFLDAFTAANIQEWQRGLSLEGPDSSEQQIKIDEPAMEMPLMVWDGFEEQAQQSPYSDLLTPIAATWEDFIGDEIQQISAHDHLNSTSVSQSSLFPISTECIWSSRQSAPALFDFFHAVIEQDELEYMQRIGTLSVPQEPLC